MFNNSSHVDASHSTFSEVHRDQHFISRANVQGNQTINTVVHGNQIVQSSQIGLEVLQKASAPSAAFDSVERHPAPRCLEGTRVQLLDRIKQWVDCESDDDKVKPICWVNGRPGSGKSAVSQTIAEGVASQNRLAASFFFSRRDIARRTTRHFFPTVATQVLYSIPAIRPVILAALERDCMIPSKVLREQMQKLLLEPLSSGLEQPGAPLLIIVDALDECDDPRLVVELVSLLVQLVRNSALPLRLLITSRPEPWLQAHFRHPDVTSITLTLEIQSFTVEDDIRSFLQYSLNQVYQEHLEIMPEGPWPSPEDLNRIVEKASGLFIFAMTVVKFVGDGMHNPIQRLQAILEDRTSRDTAYSDLDALYRDAVSTFPDADTVRLILGIVYCLSVPVTVSALHHLLDKRDVDARIVIPALSSVLLSSENGEQPIQFYHASFRDFLISPQRSRKYTIDPVVYHRLMAQLCFELMVRSLKRNMCNFDDPSKLNRDIEDLPERRQAAYNEALLYACRYWSYHLTQLPAQGIYDSLLNAMQEFCSKVLLYWIEAASLFQDVDNAIIVLRDALNWLKSLSAVPNETLTLIDDAERLALLYRLPISQSAPHVYHTAITFSPSSSALYANFKHEAGCSFTINMGQDDEWQAYQYAIDLGLVVSIAFSPSGSVVATAGKDHGIQLWNVITGGNVASLGDEASSLLVCYSNSGAYLSAAFTDGTVAVWDPVLGREYFKDVDAHTDMITCLEFSPDSTLLASGSRDQTIQLWSLDSTQRLHKLTAHEGPVTALAFTPDSLRLCSGSEDNLLIVWDLKIGRISRGMMGHRSGITTLDVSRDGNMVVTGSQDKSVKIWDIRSGKCVRTVAKGHNKAVLSVHFFDDDRRFISASDGTILSGAVSTRKSSADATVWELGQNLQAAMGSAPLWQAKVLAHGMPAFLLRKLCEGNYESSADEKLLIAYSPQTSSFAFSYLSETWYSPFGVKVDKPHIHTSQGYLTSLALSSDGTCIAAGNCVGSMDILHTAVSKRSWDEEMKRSLAVPLRTAQSVVPCSNGSRFIVNSGLAWYLTDGQFRLLCKIDFGIADYARNKDVERPVFSADSSTFAWAMSDIWERQNHTMVRVYESTTGTQKVRFSGLKKIQAFVLSYDGNYVACGHEGAITVCDVGTQAKMAMDVLADASITALDFSSDSRTLLGGSKGGVLQLWSVASGECKATIAHADFTSPATAVRFAPLGDMAAIAHEDWALRVVSLSTTTSAAAASHTLCPGGIEFNNCTAKEITFLQDPRKLACRTGDNEVSFWAVPPEIFASVSGDGGEVSCPVCAASEKEDEPEEDVPASETGENNPESQTAEDDAQPQTEEDNLRSQTEQDYSQSQTADTPQPQPEEEPPSEDSEPPARAEQDGPPSLPHLISQHKDQVFDCLFRSPYTIHKDGWVCKEDRRLFWLPQHLRPLRNDPQFSALGNKMMILTHNRQVIFLTLPDDA